MNVRPYLVHMPKGFLEVASLEKSNALIESRLPRHGCGVVERLPSNLGVLDRLEEPETTLPVFTFVVPASKSPLPVESLFQLHAARLDHQNCPSFLPLHSSSTQAQLAVFDELAQSRGMFLYLNTW